MVEQWCSLSPHNKEVLGSIPGSDIRLCEFSAVNPPTDIINEIFFLHITNVFSEVCFDIHD